MEHCPTLTCPVARPSSGSQPCSTARFPASALVSAQVTLATGNFAPLLPTKGSNGDEEVGAVNHKLFHPRPRHECVSCPVARCLCAVRRVSGGLTGCAHLLTSVILEHSPETTAEPFGSPEPLSCSSWHSPLRWQHQHLCRTKRHKRGHTLMKLALM